MSRLRGKNVRSVHTVCNRVFEIVECDIPENGAVAGRKLKDVAIPGEFLVLLVRRSGEAEFSIPGGDTMLAGGDRVVFAVRSGDVKAIRMFAGRN
jgi:trk system potassium uptake protein TrkA